MRAGKIVVIGIGAALAGVVIAVALFLNGDRSSGRLSGERLERVRQSSHWRDGQFVNTAATEPLAEGSYWSALKDYFRDSAKRSPSKPIRSMPFAPESFLKAGGTNAVWLGHSTVLLSIDNTVLLTDPVFEDRVAISMGLRMTGRFFASPASRDRLPQVDAVLISHDHFDHLEESTVRFFAGTATEYIVPLGLGAYLAGWGMPEDQITELDWGDSVQVGQVMVYCTPARHLSGRSPFHRNQSFWASWVMAGDTDRVFYSGDSGPGEHFAEIGRDYGPFNLTLMQIGAYDENWPDIHLTPEQAVTAQGDLRGALLLPVHWGTFDLALHAWDDPIIRLQRSAKEAGITIVTPLPGESVRSAYFNLNSRWWQFDEEPMSHVR